MTNTPMAIEVNCETGVVTERPLTAEEIAQQEIDKAAFEQAEAERQAEEARVEALKQSAKAKLIAGQPLTEDEAGVLVI
jgi:hypothetical protein